MNWVRQANLEELIGQTLVDIEVCKNGDDRITFKTKKGDRYLMHHVQECSERVYIQRSNDLNQLLNKQLITASVVATSKDDNGLDRETKTVFTFETEDYTAQIVWHGESNGYYSEGVDFEKISTVF